MLGGAVAKHPVGGFFRGPQGIEGGIFQMLSHGWVSAALFLCVGVIYDRMHTRDISAYGGLVTALDPATGGAIR